MDRRLFQRTAAQPQGLADLDRGSIMAAGTPAVSETVPLPVASWSHTALVLIAILGVSGYGFWFAHTHAYVPGPSPERDIIPAVYVPAVIYEWALLGLVWLGIRRTTGLGGLTGGRWDNAPRAVADFALGFVFWGAWYVVETLVQHLLGPAHASPIDYFFPRSGMEIAFWIVSAVTSGFCEEIVFRGYLLKQFSAWTGSVPTGVLMQAGLFGAAPPLLGWKQMIVICISGLLFALLALWRKSLRPGMVAHAWADIFGGIILKGLPYK